MLYEQSGRYTCFVSTDRLVSEHGGAYACFTSIVWPVLFTDECWLGYMCEQSGDVHLFSEHSLACIIYRCGSLYYLQMWMSVWLGV